MYSGLDELVRFRVPDPNDLEAGLYSPVLNPEEVTGAYLLRDAREQSASSAEATS